MGRKQRRALEKQTKKQEQIASKVALFGHLPESCSTCRKEFDKKDKDMVTSWSVVVRESAKTVRLFCPECIEKTKEKIDERG
jgi:hypothetical protein|tara:strand:+ start:264 stop:509 length:246 start_codon:yes stop_codon:yes gene_type:complete